MRQALPSGQDAARWTRLEPGTPRLWGVVSAWDSTRRRLVVLGRRTPSAAATNETWEWDERAWIPIVERSAPQGGFTIAYDEARSVAILLEEAVWPSWRTSRWDGANWNMANAPREPDCPGRLTYEPVLGRLVFLCAGPRPSRWSWDGATWTSEALHAAGPLPTVFTAVVYDRARSRLVAVYDNEQSSDEESTTWELTGDTWIIRDSQPRARWLRAIGYSPSRRQVVALSSATPSWMLGWNGSAWTAWSEAVTEYDPSFFESDAPRVVAFNLTYRMTRYESGGGGPSDETDVAIPRSRVAQVFSQAPGGSVLLFGGYAEGPKADTWIWRHAAWSRPDVVDAPPARFAAAGAFDSSRGRVVIFGGSSAAGDLTDTWEWTGTEWRERHPNQHPVARHDHAMAYDPVRARVVLTGGVQGSTRLDDTWEWDGSDWSVVSSGESFTPRAEHAMTYDLANGEMVLYGGRDVGALADTWTRDMDGWHTRRPQHDPGPRERHRLVSDEGRRTVLLIDSGVWEWDGRDWSTRRNVGPEQPAFRDGAAFHPRGVVAFGNAGNTNKVLALTLGGDLGVPCIDASSCLSGNCADGVCCDRPCAGQCEACAEPSLAGRCQVIEGAPRGTRIGCGETGPCAGVCDGDERRACRYPVAGTACAAPACDVTGERGARGCDGAGRCSTPSATRDCGAYGCDGPRCRVSCERDEQCAPGAICEASAGTCRAGDRCERGHLSRRGDGTIVDCNPYSCEIDGRCKVACASVRDCAAPHVCDASGVCVSPPAERTASCSTAAGGEVPRFVVVLWLCAIAGWSRRSRR